MTYDYYDPDEAEQRFDADMEQLDRIAELERVNSEYMDINHEQGMQLIEKCKRIEQLEERIGELARENAELKQVPRHSEDAPRCPLRDSMTGEMGACDKRCALIVRVGGVLMCAEAARVADKAKMEPVRAVNYWNEVD